MPVATIVCNKIKQQFYLSFKRVLVFLELATSVLSKFLLCSFAYHNNFYWYRNRYLVFESIIYFFNYHADKNGEESSNKICNVGGSNSFKCFDKSLKNKKNTT